MRISLREYLAAACAFVVTTTVGAQSTAADPVGPQVGEMAPDFTLQGATKMGPSATPIRLADLRGQTVVIAFFPKARTGG
jgi:peroxiredoxin Q/BCP